MTSMHMCGSVGTSILRQKFNQLIKSSSYIQHLVNHFVYEDFIDG
jgi:hypothetical protein